MKKILIAIALTLTALFGVGVATASPAPSPRVLECTYAFGPQLRPSTFILECATAGVYVSNIKWTSWTATSAVGLGVIHAQTCQPNCADGGWYPPGPVLILLGRVRRVKISSHPVKLAPGLYMGSTWKFSGGLFTEMSVWSLDLPAASLSRFVQEGLPVSETAWAK